jgi:hypothetical protein
MQGLLGTQAILMTERRGRSAMLPSYRTATQTFPVDHIKHWLNDSQVPYDRSLFQEIGRLSYLQIKQIMILFYVLF